MTTACPRSLDEPSACPPARSLPAAAHLAIEHPSRLVLARRRLHAAREAGEARWVTLRRAGFDLAHVETDEVPERRLGPVVPRRRYPADRLVEVPLDALLLGGEPGVSPRRLAAERGDPMRLSTRFVDATLADAGRPRACGWADAAAADAGEEVAVVQRVRHSSCYQLQDTSPGLVRAARRGDRAVVVRELAEPVTTPLQDLLARTAWLGGRRLLYQPLDAPEVAGWPLVRTCTDRLALMQAFLAEHRGPRPHSYLDVGSCYGWFVARMLDAGYDGRGIERDPLAIRVGDWVYGLDPGRVTPGEADEVLASMRGRVDVVSCFSVLHHRVIAGPAAAERLVQRLDAVTGHVLFLDTGEEHEAWLRHLLPGWNPRAIAAWLARHTSFTRVVPLGVDHDRRPPNGDNYGRTLFACVRE